MKIKDAILEIIANEPEYPDPTKKFSKEFLSKVEMVIKDKGLEAILLLTAQIAVSETKKSLIEKIEKL